MKILANLLLLMIFMHFSGIGSAQESWEVPEKHKKKSAPFMFERNHIKDGKTIYYKQCASCHGDMGQENFKQLSPAPNDLANTQIALNTDGELYYKITVGRTLMPQFAGVIGEMELWKTIAYIRSFHPEYVAQTGMIIKAEEYKGDSVIIETQALKDSKRIKLRVFGFSQGNKTPLEGVPIGIYTPRMFGDLLIGNIVETDEYGFAFVDYPEGLPGDEEGFLDLRIKLEDEEVYGQVEKLEQMQVGAPANPVNVLEGRHMWSTRDKAPLWLLISFFTVVIGVWGTIFYIVIKIFGIKKIA